MNAYPSFSWALNRELTGEEWRTFCAAVHMLASEGLPALIQGQESLPCPAGVWKWVWKKRQALFVQSHTPAFQWGRQGALEGEPVLEIMPGPHRVSSPEHAQAQQLRVLKLPHQGIVAVSDELFFLPVVVAVLLSSQPPGSAWSCQIAELPSRQVEEWLTWGKHVLDPQASQRS